MISFKEKIDINPLHNSEITQISHREYLEPMNSIIEKREDEN